MRYWVSLFLLLFTISITAQRSKNIDLVSNVQTDATGSEVWGFKHSNGIEYAIMGDLNSTHVFSLEDPANPVQVADVPGANSTWRDIKNYKDVLYVVADRGQDGLLVIDLSMIDQDSVSHTFLNLEVETAIQTDEIRTCHNLYLDQEDGFLYLSGCNISNGGVIILDVKENPLLPKVVGVEDLNYAHDVYTRDDLMFASEIFVGQMAIYDVSEKSDPKLLGTINTPNNFTHNIWSSDDNKYAFTTDERTESTVGAYDISDPSDIKFLDKFKTAEGVGAIPHNTHFDNEYLFTSWYTEGVIVTDVTRPDNMVEVGFYDTWTGASGGFNGCWGAYPYLPSGLLLASDRQSGLYVLRPDLPRAAYLEGTVSEFDINEDGSPITINGVTVNIESGENNGLSNPNGIFKTGICASGTYNVNVRNSEYFPYDTTVVLVEGQVTNLDIKLRSRPQHFFRANTEVASGGPPSASQVIVINDDQSYTLVSGGDGTAFGEVYEGDYQVYGGSWGWKQADLGELSIETNTEIDILLEPGYEDDFLFDFGWEVEGFASAGEWVRAEPIPTFFGEKNSNVDFDIQGDLGESCFMTGNAGGQAGTDDVDNGTTILTSPIIDLKDLDDPHLKYYAWFYNDGGEIIDPNDTLKTFIIAQDSMILVDAVTGNREPGSWLQKSIPIRDFVTDDTIRISYVVTDDVENGHILEAGIDVFRITEGETSSNEELPELSLFQAFPNPLFDQLTIKGLNEVGTTQLRIYDVKGRLQFKDQLLSKEKNINLEHLHSGIYFLHLVGQDFQQTIKLIKS